VIAALALTHTRAGDNPFHMYRANAWNRISTGYRHFVAMDPDNDTAYFTYNYQATSTISFYKQKLSRHLLRVNSPYMGTEETALNYSLTGETISDRNYWDVTPDYDGYIYLLATQGNQSGNATVYLRRLKASADHFSLEEDTGFRQTLVLPEVALYPSSASKNYHTMALCVSNGYLYALSYDRKSVYRSSLQTLPRSAGSRLTSSDSRQWIAVFILTGTAVSGLSFYTRSQRQPARQRTGGPEVSYMKTGSAGMTLRPIQPVPGT
jgi:hypothetical protein